MTRQHDLNIIRAACVAANPAYNNFCCKYQSINAKEFCDDCLVRKIRLSDVLLAIVGENYKSGWDADNVNEIVAKYNLRDDTLDAQSDATLSFLGGLLG